MKNILFDFVTLQDSFINGGMLYTERILCELLKKSQLKIYGLYDGKRTLGERAEKYIKQNNIELIDVQSSELNAKIAELGISAIFIGVAQRYNDYNLSDINCKIYIVCHDVFDLSIDSFLKFDTIKAVQKFSKDNSPKKSFLKKLATILLYPLVLLRRGAKRRRQQKQDKICYDNFTKLLGRENVQIITVSDYSKSAIEYYIGSPKNEIIVFFPPLVSQWEQVCSPCGDIERLVAQSGKYFLFVAANRIFKNAALFFEQWDRFCKKTDYNYKCVLLGAKDMRIDKANCIALDYVSAADLDYLFKNAFSLVFASVVEGFGYPPIEAAARGVPSVCSNVTSIPEVCGDMSVYFSPFYPEDLYKAMLEMTNNREKYAVKAISRYRQICDRQEKDLQSLVSLISE